MLAKDSMLSVTNLVSMDNFGDWIAKQLKERSWTQADLTRATGLDSSVISNLINNRRGPGIESCKAIASAFRLPPEIVMRAAGLLPQVTDGTEKREEILHLFDMMSKEKKQDLINYAQFLLAKD